MRKKRRSEHTHTYGLILEIKRNEKLSKDNNNNKKNKKKYRRKEAEDEKQKKE